MSEAKTLSAARETSKVSSLYSWGLGGAVGLPPMGPVRSPGKFRILENPFWSSELHHQWVNSHVYQVLWILSSDKFLTLPSLSRCCTCEEPQSLPFLVLSTTSFPFSHSKEIDKSNQIKTYFHLSERAYKFSGTFETIFKELGFPTNTGNWSRFIKN